MVQRDGSVLVNKLTKVFVRGLQLNKAAEAIQASMDNTAIGVKTSTTLSGLRDIQVSQVMNRGKMIYYVRSGNVKSYNSIKKQAEKLKKKDIDFIISGY